MTADEAKVGTRVVTLNAWTNVPAGTQGVIDEDYDTGVMVAWDLPNNPLPAGYVAWTYGHKMSLWLRDGFEKNNELKYLKVYRPEFKRNILV